MINEAKRVDEVYITSRYPNGLQEGTPEEFYKESDSKECIKLAEKKSVPSKSSAGSKKVSQASPRGASPIWVFLFGSVARGDVHALSDIDLLIIADFQGSPTDRVERILNIAQNLRLTLLPGSRRS